MEKCIWVCEDCLSENLEKNEKGKIEEWRNFEDNNIES